VTKNPIIKVVDEFSNLVPNVKVEEIRLTIIKADEGLALNS